MTLIALASCRHDFAFLQPLDDSDGATHDGAVDQLDGSADSTGVIDGSTEAGSVVRPPAIFHRLAVGSAFACAIHPSDEVVRCFGANNAYQLGNGTRADPSDPGSLTWTDVVDVKSVPTRKMPFANASSLSAGDVHGCALRSNDVFCWGGSVRGEAGLPNAVAAPVQVDLMPGFDAGSISQLVSGGYHVCAIAEADVFCWGFNGLSQISGASSAPIIAMTSLHIPGVRRLALGAEFSLALLDDGGVLCWGDDSQQQCGMALAEDCPLSPRDSCVVAPTQIPNLGPARDVAGGAFHACAIGATDGKVRCWGGNIVGQVGAAVSDACTFGGTCTADVTEVAGIDGAEQLAIGSRQSCALLNHQVFCWGMGEMLGNNTTSEDPSPTPSPVVLENGSMLTNIVEIGASTGITCARDGDGNVYCWGVIADESVYGARLVAW